MAKTINALFHETMEQLMPTVLSDANPSDAPLQKIINALRADPDLTDRFVETLLTCGDLEVPKTCKNDVLELIIHHVNTEVRLTSHSMIVHLREGLNIHTCGKLPILCEILDRGGLTEKHLYSFPHPFLIQTDSIIQMVRTVGEQEQVELYARISDDDAIRISEQYRQQVY